MKPFVTALAVFALVGVVRADELEDSYNNLKAAVEKKDADGVKRLAPAVAKLAKAASSAAGEGEDAKDKAKFAADTATYAEYALGATAQAGVDSGKVVELYDALVALNSKSKYLDYGATRAYVVAMISLTESTAAKSPATGLNYATKLTNFVKSKPKPEGGSEADWEKVKSAALGTGYYISGAIHAQKMEWVDCDRDLRAAQPLVTDAGHKGPMLFYLGLCNYQFGKLTNDRARMNIGIKFTDEAATIPGPMQAQARQNAYAMKTTK